MRALFVLAVILAVVAQARTGPSWKNLEGYTFAEYCSDFDRSYKGAEYSRREMVFNNRLREVLAHNADSSQSWKKGVNHFSDWTDAEFSRYNTLKPSNMARRHEEATEYKVNEGRDLPAEVDYRKWTAPRVLTGIKNQGACGGCWGFSSAESVESYFAIHTGQLPVLSPQQILSCAVQYESVGCGGGFISDGWKYIKEHSTGLNEEWLYPFTDFFAANETMAATAKCQNITKLWSKPEGGFPWYPKAGITGYGRVKANSAFDTMHALAFMGPQSISVAADSWLTYEGGILQNNYSESNNTVWGINHAVQLVGYGHDFDLKMDYWVVRNSWGTEWGEDGFIRLAKPEHEPCGNAPQNGPGVVCGTSGVLSSPDHPFVKQLKKKN